MKMRSAIAFCLAWVCTVGQAAQTPAQRSELLSDVRDSSAWTASASDQVKATLRRDSSDGSLCLDYDFAGVSGYAVMRRSLPLDWPEHFALQAQLKSSGAVNDLQIKLGDASGDNVWWINRPNATLPAKLESLNFRERHVEFAWGPIADKRLRHTESIELVVSAGREGGRGSVCLARLERSTRAADPTEWPEARWRMVDARTADFDFQWAREFNGLALSWPENLQGLDYDVLASDDGRRWRSVRKVRGSNGGLDAIFLPESQSRLIRVRQLCGADVVSKLGLELRSAAQWPTMNAVLSAMAVRLPRGDVPRTFLHEQNYWTLVGVNGGGDHSALMSEDGALELGRGGYSVEPAIRLGNGKWVTWADVKLSQQLRDGYLPMPSVRWGHANFDLQVEAAADGTSAAPELLASYTLHNPTAQPQTLTLMLAVRPWQVNPPQQFLATAGGASAIDQLAWHAGQLHVNGKPSLKPNAPAVVRSLPLDGGLALSNLHSAPLLTLRVDTQSMASAALEFTLTLPPGGQQTVAWTAPLAASVQPGTTDVDARMDAVAAYWRERLNRTQLQVPIVAQPVVDTLRTSLAHILMSRDGAALRPGTRSYARSWIRDGAMMVAGLVRIGELDAAREYVDWFGGRVFASGKVPCCVDQRGSDPVVENDSHGQYIYAVAEVWRHTHDRAWLERQWPRLQQVGNWIEQQRQSEMREANRPPERARYFGLMPPSISHEGYSDKPAYSYWDDFWTMRGLKDLVLVAQALDRKEAASTWISRRDEFQRNLVSSIALTAQHYQLTYIAGAADRGDFDATSTTMALNPAQAQDVLPAGLLENTFEKYWSESLARAQGRRASKDYTPYELRTVGALVRLGQVERAHAMLQFFFADQRPAGWDQWAEVVLPDAREVRFLGDMPHAWVSSDYIRSALDMFAYEREPQDAIVIGAGFTPQWRNAGSIEVRGMSTAYGKLDYTLAPRQGGWALELPTSVATLQGLRGGLRLAWPGTEPLPRATVNGKELPWQGRELALPTAPATVLLFTNN